jgi:glycerophosphoryl diester phosphodiesterase
MSPVVFHDDTLDRVTHGTGKIGAWTLGNLQKLCLAAKHPLGSSFPAPVPIPHLEDFIKECLNLKMKMIMDLKTYEIPEETALEVIGMYKKYPEMRTCTIVTRKMPYCTATVYFDTGIL